MVLGSSTVREGETHFCLHVLPNYTIKSPSLYFPPPTTGVATPKTGVLHSGVVNWDPPPNPQWIPLALPSHVTSTSPRRERGGVGLLERIWSAVHLQHQTHSLSQFPHPITPPALFHHIPIAALAVPGSVHSSSSTPKMATDRAPCALQAAILQQRMCSNSYPSPPSSFFPS